MIEFNNSQKELVVERHYYIAQALKLLTQTENKLQPIDYKLVIEHPFGLTTPYGLSNHLRKSLTDKIYIYHPVAVSSFRIESALILINRFISICEDLFIRIIYLETESKIPEEYEVYFEFGTDLNAFLFGPLENRLSDSTGTSCLCIMKGAVEILSQRFNIFPFIAPISLQQAKKGRRLLNKLFR